MLTPKHPLPLFQLHAVQLTCPFQVEWGADSVLVVLLMEALCVAQLAAIGICLVLAQCRLPICLGPA